MRIVFALVVFVLFSGCGYLYGPMTEKEIDVVISKSERVCSGGEKTSCKYMVFTDKGTFKNTDSLYGAKWNSSDLHGMFKEGMKCKFTVIGWRAPLLSMYQNVIGAECDKSILKK